MLCSCMLDTVRWRKREKTPNVVPIHKRKSNALVAINRPNAFPPACFFHPRVFEEHCTVFTYSCAVSRSFSSRLSSFLVWLLNRRLIVVLGLRLRDHNEQQRYMARTANQPCWRVRKSSPLYVAGATEGSRCFR